MKNGTDEDVAAIATLLLPSAQKQSKSGVSPHIGVVYKACNLSFLLLGSTLISGS